MGGKYGCRFLVPKRCENLSATFQRWDEQSQSLVNSHTSAADYIDLIHALRVARVTWLLPAVVYACSGNCTLPEGMSGSNFGNTQGMSAFFYSSRIMYEPAAGPSPLSLLSQL